MITTTPMPLEQAVRELTDYNERCPFEIRGLRPPDMNYYRKVIYKEELYQVCLTRMFMAKSWLWMLSVMKPDAEPTASGAHLPTQAEAEEIAAAFFPKGYTALNESHQIITMTCLKFIATETGAVDV